MNLLHAAVLISAFTFASGLNCFECAYMEDGSTPKSKKSSCEKGTGNMVSTLCDQYERYCMKVSGTQIEGGGSVGLRGCASQWGSFLELEGVKSKCFSTDSITPKYDLRILKTIISHRNGELCLCDSTECNGQGIMSLPSVQIITFAIAIVFIIFLNISL